MKLFLIVIVTHMITSICVAQPKDSSHVLHGLFSDSNPNQIYYGSFDLDTLQFNNISSLSISDVGDPNRVQYPALPFAYNPYDGVIYIAAPANENLTILSIINATNGTLISTFKSITNPVASLEYDIFDNKLFACIAAPLQLQVNITEINTNDGSLKTPLITFINWRASPISSYSPITRQYFYIISNDFGYRYVIVNTSLPGNYSSIGINSFPISMRFDYKTSTMYMTYTDHPDKFISSLGILDRTTGGISKVVRTFTYNPSLVVTSLSAYDIAQNIYYLSYQLTKSNSSGISYVNVDTAEIAWAPLPPKIVKSHGWFVNEFADKRKFI